MTVGGCDALVGAAVVKNWVTALARCSGKLVAAPAFGAGCGGVAITVGHDDHATGV